MFVSSFNAISAELSWRRRVVMSGARLRAVRSVSAVPNVLIVALNAPALEGAGVVSYGVTAVVDLAPTASDGVSATAAMAACDGLLLAAPPVPLLGCSHVHSWQRIASG